jgi:two-component system, chemotaxis family, CheB/CheR fusion protein
MNQATTEASATVELGGAEPYVVGIGASAGGLSALQSLLASMPPAPGFACVIVVHLSPEHESHLSELLQQRTAMRVQQVTSTVALEPNNVYVIPPNANLDTIDTHLRLSGLEQRRNERAPIDHFLRTLAATHDGTAIGVILTGGGSDGSIGVRYIKECGGLAIAQDPTEAEFDSMPRSAIATGMIDLVLPLHSISEEIVSFCATHPQLPVIDSSDRVHGRDEILLARIVGELRTRTQLDFSGYKRSVLLRRLRRRMQLSHVTTFGAYLEALSRQPNEAGALAHDLALVTTEFFQDTESFRTLERYVVPRIFERKTRASDGVRAWSIGCATGEEAYSLAVLLAEERTRRRGDLQLQVFASEVSDKALYLARSGIYPKEIAAAVSPERLERFFIANRGLFKVKPELHEIVLFTRHNLFIDPPFARLDLIVCRTLLSQLQPKVRRGVLKLFHYALQPGAMLLVGPHDEVDLPELFEPEDGAVGLFRKMHRVGQSHINNLPSSVQPFGWQGVRGLREVRSLTAAAGGPVPNRYRVGNDDLAALYRTAVEPLAPPGVLIGADDEVVHFSTHARRYIHIPGGEPTSDLLRLVAEPIRAQLRTALPLVRSQLRPWHSAPIAVAMGGGTLRHVVLRVQPVALELILVVFDEMGEDVVPPAGSSETKKLMDSMESEILTIRDRLREATQAKGADPAGTHGDRADGLSRQDVEDATQQLQSVLEEVASSKEELQAINEELLAVDQENRRRLKELTQTSSDLQHLLASTGVATLFLDRDLRIVRFTPLFANLFGLRNTDIGRPISDLARLNACEGLESDAQLALRLEHTDREMKGPDGRWYLNRVLPYRTEGGQLEGVVLTLIDISERKRAELALREADRSKDEFLAVLAHELRNPLAPISSGVEVLMRSSQDSGTVERIATTIGRQSKQLIRLVDDLLEVSRIRGGKLQLRSSIIDLRDVIEDALAAARPAIGRQAHRLEINITDEPMTVVGDAARLTQVLSNLLSNAVRYTPPRGTISLSATREGERVVVTVKDSGVGIPRESIERVFEMFYQIRSSGPQSGAGLGIGLTLAKTLIELHGGSISARSSGLNQGSEFKVQLPVTTSPLPLKTRVDEQPVDRAHRILIVDDNVDAAESLCLLMKSLGKSDVRTAASGPEALQTAEQLHPDIVLLDLMMPGMDGYEVARRLRREPWGAELLLVALSGWGHEEQRRRSKEAGFDRHVTKPADLATLRALLSERPPRRQLKQQVKCKPFR